MGAVFKLEPAREAENAALNVTASVRGFVWRERLDPAGAGTALAMSQRYKLPELLGRVLAARGVGLDEVPVALEPTVKALMPDPSTLRDMDVAAGRLADAIARRETVALFGDYDVDGACSSALMARYLAAHGLKPRIYIPDRMTEGYGPNAAAIEALAKEGATLIVAVDCGTTSFEPLAVARRLGVDVVVVDHHQADERLPEVAALVNPNRQDDVSGLGHLCAAGVTFMLLVAVARELRQRGRTGNHNGGAPAPVDLLEMLDLVALATVCDVVPLRGLNRAYVARGLEVLRQRRNTGLRALADAAGLAVPPTAYHLGFVLGPRINAGGRIGDSGLGARLLALADETEAARIAALLDKLNRERKAIETKMLEEAMLRADSCLEAYPDTPVLIVASEGFHKGVVGLVASRLVERFHRPACVISWDGARAGHRLAALHRRGGHRRRGAGGGGGRASRQGRRPYHGGGPVGAPRASRRPQRISPRAPGRYDAHGARTARAQHRRGADARRRHRRADGADRARRAVRAGQPRAALRLPGPAREIRQGGG